MRYPPYSKANEVLIWGPDLNLLYLSNNHTRSNEFDKKTHITMGNWASFKIDGAHLNASTKQSKYIYNILFNINY